MRRFNVVIAKEDGGIEMYPMREWLRNHPDQIPSGMTLEKNNSWRLRHGLKRLGWSSQETEAEVRLIQPSSTAEGDDIEAILGASDLGEDSDEDLAEFVFEKHLEDFLVQNWSQTELGKEYDIFCDDGERAGQQYPTDTGPMDILAISKDKSKLLVVELKKGRASDAVVGQILRYMGYVAQELAKPGQSVHGVIVALEDDQRIRRALVVAPNIAFYKYQVSFKLVKS